MALFNNLSLFRFQEMPGLTSEVLGAALKKCPARSCGPLELNTMGFKSLLGSHEDDILIRLPNGALVFEAAGEDKSVPKSLVRKRAQAVLEKRKKEVGRPASKGEVIEVTNKITNELMAQALPREYSVKCMIDLQTGWLVVGAQSDARAEAVVSAIRKPLGSFPARPVTPKLSVQAEMTRWLMERQAPEPLVLGEDCDLCHPEDASRSWRGRTTELYGDEVATHLKAGMVATLLGLRLGEDGPRFMIDRSLHILKLDAGLPNQPKDDKEEKADALTQVAAQVEALLPVLVVLEKLFDLVRPAAVSMADSAARALEETSPAMIEAAYG